MSDQVKTIFELRADTTQFNRRMTAATKRINDINAALERLKTTTGMSTSQAFAAMSDSLNKTSNSASKATKKLTAMDYVTRRLSVAFGIMIAMRVARWFVRTSIEAVSLSENLEYLITRINALTVNTEFSAKQLSDMITDMSTRYGVAAENIAEGMFFISSAGITGAQSLELLDQATKMSYMGLGDMKNIAMAASAAVNAWSDTNMTAAEATDTLYRTVKYGNMEISGLANTIGRAMPVAATLGISFDELGASVAVMTKYGANAAKSITMIRRFMLALTDPSHQAAEAMEHYGVSAEGLRKTIKEEGLLSAINELVDATHGEFEAITEIIPNIRALVPALVMVKENGGDVAAVFEGMKDKTDDVSKAYSEFADQSKHKTQELSSAWKLFLREFGENLDEGFLNKTKVTLTIALHWWANYFAEIRKMKLVSPFPGSTDEMENTIVKVENAIRKLIGLYKEEIPALASSHNIPEMMSSHGLSDIVDAMDDVDVSLGEVRDSLFNLGIAEADVTEKTVVFHSKLGKTIKRLEEYSKQAQEVINVIHPANAAIAGQSAFDFSDLIDVAAIRQKFKDTEVTFDKFMKDADSKFESFGEKFTDAFGDINRVMGKFMTDFDTDGLVDSWASFGERAGQAFFGALFDFDNSKEQIANAMNKIAGSFDKTGKIGKLVGATLQAGMGAYALYQQTKSGKKLSVMSGVMQGAAAGAAFGVVGMAVGAVVGLVASLMSKKKKYSFGADWTGTGYEAYTSSNVSDPELQSMLGSVTQATRSLHSSFMDMIEMFDDVGLLLITSMSDFNGEFYVEGKNYSEVLQRFIANDLPKRMRGQFWEALVNGFRGLDIGVNADFLNALIEQSDDLLGDAFTQFVMDVVKGATDISNAIEDISFGSVSAEVARGTFESFNVGMNATLHNIDLVQARMSNEMSLDAAARDVSRIAEMTQNARQAEIDMLRQINGISDEIAKSIEQAQELLSLRGLTDLSKLRYFMSGAVDSFEEIGRALNPEDLQESANETSRFLANVTGLFTDEQLWESTVGAFSEAMGGSGSRYLQLLSEAFDVSYDGKTLREFFNDLYESLGTESQAGLDGFTSAVEEWSDVLQNEAAATALAFTGLTSVTEDLSDAVSDLIRTINGEDTSSGGTSGLRSASGRAGGLISVPFEFGHEIMIDPPISDDDLGALDDYGRALDDIRQHELEMLAKIAEAQMRLNDEIFSSIEELALGGMNDLERSIYWSRRLGESFDDLRDAITPEQVTEAAEAAMRDVQGIVSALGEDQLDELATTAFSGLYRGNEWLQRIFDATGLSPEEDETARQFLIRVYQDLQTESDDMFATLREQATIFTDSLLLNTENVTKSFTTLTESADVLAGMFNRMSSTNVNGDFGPTVGNNGVAVVVNVNGTIAPLINTIDARIVRHTVAGRPVVA